MAEAALEDAQAQGRHCFQCRIRVILWLAENGSNIARIPVTGAPRPERDCDERANH